MTPTQDTPRLAAPGDRITRSRMSVAHIVRHVRTGVTESASAGRVAHGQEVRPFAVTRCGFPMWATLVDPATLAKGAGDVRVSWIPPAGMRTCSACELGGRVSATVRERNETAMGVKM